MIPVHYWYNILGRDWCRHRLLDTVSSSPWCRALVKFLNLTGNYSLSTVGTKLAAINLNPLVYLSDFGEFSTLLHHVAINVEKYFVGM